MLYKIQNGIQSLFSNGFNVTCIVGSNGIEIVNEVSRLYTFYLPNRNTNPKPNLKAKHNHSPNHNHSTNPSNPNSNPDTVDFLVGFFCLFLFLLCFVFCCCCCCYFYVIGLHICTIALRKKTNKAIAFIKVFAKARIENCRNDCFIILF